jgi:hypothetical protein
MTETHTDHESHGFGGSKGYAFMAGWMTSGGREAFEGVIRYEKHKEILDAERFPQGVERSGESNIRQPVPRMDTLTATSCPDYDSWRSCEVSALTDFS